MIRVEIRTSYRAMTFFDRKAVQRHGHGRPRPPCFTAGVTSYLPEFMLRKLPCATHSPAMDQQDGLGR